MTMAGWMKVLLMIRPRLHIFQGPVCRRASYLRLIQSGGMSRLPLDADRQLGVHGASSWIRWHCCMIRYSNKSVLAGRCGVDCLILIMWVQSKVVNSAPYCQVGMFIDVLHDSTDTDASAWAGASVGTTTCA